MLNLSLKRSITVSTNEENPIVLQLQEFGYSSNYSKRVFYYLHPEDLEEALNYMSTENNIIQHRFLKDRNTLNKSCYICGEPEENHLKEFNNNNNINHNNINNHLEKREEDNKTKEEDNNENDNSKYIIHNSVLKTKNIIKESLQNNNIKNSLDINTKINNSISYFEPSNNKKNKDDIKSNLSFNIIKKINNTKNEVKTEEIKEECRICNEKFIVDSSNTLTKCGHSFCSSCWFDALTVKIKENKLPTIKCLDYNCKEKLSDQFILNILSLDINLIKIYKRYKLELEIINNDNKKLCPYPNCDSFLE